MQKKSVDENFAKSGKNYEYISDEAESPLRTLWMKVLHTRIWHGLQTHEG